MFLKNVIMLITERKEVGNMEILICKNGCKVDLFHVQAEITLDENGQEYESDYDIDEAICGSCLGEVEVVCENTIKS